MCRETVGIALCAPLSPSLSYACGGFHNVAATRETCDQIKGACDCFFGTCGQINTVVKAQAVDFGSIPKIRCLDCTTRSVETDGRCEGHLLADSPLLSRVPIPQESLKTHLDKLKTLWNGTDDCIFHSSPTQAKKNIEATDTNKQHTVTCVEENETKQHQDSSQESEVTTQPPEINGATTILGIETSRWAEGSDVHEREQKNFGSTSNSRAPSPGSNRSLAARNETQSPEPVESVFDLKNLPASGLPDFKAMKAFLARS